MHYPDKKTSFLFSLATLISFAAVTAGLVSRHHKLTNKASLTANETEGPSLIENLVAHNAQGF